MRSLTFVFYILQFMIVGKGCLTDVRRGDVRQSAVSLSVSSISRSAQASVPGYAIGAFAVCRPQACFVMMSPGPFVSCEFS